MRLLLACALLIILLPALVPLGASQLLCFVAVCDYFETFPVENATDVPIVIITRVGERVEGYREAAPGEKAQVPCGGRPCDVLAYEQRAGKIERDQLLFCLPDQLRTRQSAPLHVVADVVRCASVFLTPTPFPMPARRA